jgi:hypothetical protein
MNIVVKILNKHPPTPLSPSPVGIGTGQEGKEMCVCSAPHVYLKIFAHCLFLHDDVLSSICYKYRSLTPLTSGIPS